MGNSAEILSGSVRTLNQDERLRVLKKSSLYKTKPWGLTEQVVFLNAVIEVSWTGEPEELMEFLLQVEKSFGRIRIRHWGPRTLDLDMIYNSEIESNTDFLKLPHPFFWERPFVWSLWKKYILISSLMVKESTRGFWNWMDIRM